LRYTVADIRRSYNAQKKGGEWRNDWMSALIYRPVSFWITPVLLIFSISATAVTVFSLALGFALPFVAAYGGGSAYVTVGAISVIWAVLDCVDGNIARVTRTTSDAGRYLDFITDIVFRICLYAAIGLMADSESWEFAGDGQMFGSALIAALLMIGSRLCRDYAYLAFSHRAAFQRDAGAIAKAGMFDRFVVPIFSGVDRIVPLAVFVVGELGGLAWLVLWLILYGALDLVYTQIQILGRFE
jgi:phosphatidylglycerophosphate synthase